MGGWNSGRWNRGAARCENSNRVELSTLRKRGGLVTARTTTLSWHCGGEPRGSISVIGGDSEITLVYAFTRNGGEAEQVRECVPLRYSDTNFGGRRIWLSCPKCGRRCSVLYGGSRFRCRICHRLVYNTQYVPTWERLREKADRIHLRLGGSGDASDDLPDKPKGMHWKTFERLVEQMDDAVTASTSGAIGNLMAVAARLSR